MLRPFTRDAPRARPTRRSRRLLRGEGAFQMPASTARDGPPRRRGSAAAARRRRARQRRVLLLIDVSGHEGAHSKSSCGSPTRCPRGRTRRGLHPRHAADTREPARSGSAPRPGACAPRLWWPIGTAARGSARRLASFSRCRALRLPCARRARGRAVRRARTRRARRARRRDAPLRARLARALALAARGRPRLQPDGRMQAILPISTVSATARTAGDLREILASRRARGMIVVDAHLHIWRQADLPWLAGPMQPRIFGPYEAIRRDYPDDGVPGRHRRHRSHQVGLCAGQLGARTRPRTRSPGSSRSPTRPAGRTALSVMPMLTVADVRRRSTGSPGFRCCAASASSSTGTRTRLYRFARRADRAATRRYRKRRTSRGLRLVLRSASVCGPDGRGRGAREGLSGCDLRAPACRNARGLQRGGANDSGAPR